LLKAIGGKLSNTSLQVREPQAMHCHLGHAYLLGSGRPCVRAMSHNGISVSCFVQPHTHVCVPSIGRQAVHPMAAICYVSALLKGAASNDVRTPQVNGDITFNGYQFNEFVVARTAAYVDQNSSHIAEMTVRETLDFAARVQGGGHGASLTPCLSPPGIEALHPAPARYFCILHARRFDCPHFIAAGTTTQTAT